MLYTLAVLLLIFWLVGMFSAYTMGGFIHVLVVFAVVIVVLRLVTNRPVAV